MSFIKNFLAPIVTAVGQRAYEQALQRIGECRQKGEEGTTLDLSWLGLTTLPPEIGQLTYLTEVNLYKNPLTTLPPEIGLLKSLKKLRLDSNQLTTLPSEIRHLTALTELNVGQNELTALPPEIGELRMLSELYLIGNKLAKLPPEIGQLEQLTRLDLVNNQLTSLPPQIGRLKRLRGLWLNYNKLKVLPPEIWQLTELEELCLHNTDLSIVPPEIRKLTALTRLEISDNHLKNLPPEIGQLAALTDLSLVENRLTMLPPEIGQLAALTGLDISRNQLTTLPPEIGQLTALTRLELGQNLLNKLPSQIGRLKALTRLDLSNNQFTTLPPEIGQLTALTDLLLNTNLLKTLPPELGQLGALTALWLQGNNLTTLPKSLQNLRELKWLYLHGNSALQLSPALLGGDARLSEKLESASPQSILDFYFSREQGKTRPLNEVKVILVGRGNAGKTCTVRALRDQPFRAEEQSTPGIALCDWKLAKCKGGPVMAHLWDFAGQVITHALHQFFFSVRSVYVLVLTGRENSERPDAEYWLRLIQAFGTDAEGNGPPVIVALNKWDVPGCRPRVDRGALRERYPFIRGFVEMDCKTERGIGELKKLLHQEVGRLKWVREDFPEKWDAVRRALTKGKGKRAHLTYSEYRALCQEHGVEDEGQQDSLAEILHNLGAALNYRNDPRLREATVLQPEWLTENVYALMRHAEQQEGVLTRADVDAVLAKETDAAMREYLVRLMERFEIAYPAKTSGSGRWLVPQALPDTQPEGVERFGKAEATRLRYSYQALPEGLVARAIVRLHEFIEDEGGKKQQWASGAILTREGARALLRTEPQDRQVMITVTGPAKARQQLAGLCRDELRDIHGEIRGLNPVEETQVDGAWVLTATLEEDEKQRRKTGVATRDRGTVEVSPEELNNAYSERASRTEEVWKPTVFISYSKRNVTQRKRLESELKILKNEGLLAGVWHDRMIDPGDKWDAKIQRELAEADVVIVLVGVAALATDYITEKEIPAALKLHKDGKTVVVPVILEACRWENTPLGPLNALPDKGKALNKWKPAADGWKAVADGLAKVLKRRMEEGGKG